MKTSLTIFLMVVSFILNAQDFEINSRDTINMTDANGKRQGKWVISGWHNPKSGYAPHQKMSEGMYKDNRKEGVWIDYFPSGNIKNKISFAAGRPHGPCSLYFQDGNVEEEGTWINNRWVGNYKYTYENGTIMEIIFDDKGEEISKKITPAKKEAPPKKK